MFQKQNALHKAHTWLGVFQSQQCSTVPHFDHKTWPVTTFDHGTHSRHTRAVQFHHSTPSLSYWCWYQEMIRPTVCLEPVCSKEWTGLTYQQWTNKEIRLAQYACTSMCVPLLFCLHPFVMIHWLFEMKMMHDYSSLLVDGTDWMLQKLGISSKHHYSIGCPS